MAIGTADTISFDSVVDHVQRYSDHPLIRAHQLVKPVSEFHFLILRTLLGMARTPADESLEIMAAVLMLHRGLAIHDATDHERETRKQLTVLAGDYDSSLYYWLMAKVGRIPLLASLCQAVVSINEAKVALAAGGHDLERIWTWRTQVEGDLVAAVADHTLPKADDGAKGALWSLLRTYAIMLYVQSDWHIGALDLNRALSASRQSVDRVLRQLRVQPSHPFVAFAAKTIVALQSTMDDRVHMEGVR